MIQFDQNMGCQLEIKRDCFPSWGFCLSRGSSTHISEGSSNASVGYVLLESFALYSALLICLRLEMCRLVNI